MVNKEYGVYGHKFNTSTNIMGKYCLKMTGVSIRTEQVYTGCPKQECGVDNYFTNGNTKQCNSFKHNKMQPRLVKC